MRKFDFNVEIKNEYWYSLGRLKREKDTLEKEMPWLVTNVTRTQPSSQSQRPSPQRGPGTGSFLGSGWNPAQRGKDETREEELGAPSASELPRGQTCWELSSGSETWSGVEKKISIEKKNLNGSNCFLELLHIRKGCPDIFITNLDPLCLVYNDYPSRSVPHSFMRPTNGHWAGQEEARTGIAEAGEIRQHVGSSGLGAGAPHPRSPVSSSSNILCGVPSGSDMLWIEGPRTIFKLY